MFPVFSNPVGFYALLGIPAILAIHFLQNRSKKVTTSTLFLIEALTPESRTGRVWEKLRNSLALWMQILAVLLLAWVLVKPRWLQDNSWQTIVFVVDDSLKMEPFKDDAIQAIRNDMAVVNASGIPTRWVLMTSSSHRTPLYRGEEPNRIFDALGQWSPKSGEHNPEPALRTAQSVVGENGAVRFITYSKTRVPPWQPSVGVGHVIDNVGFVGLIPEEQARGSRWRVAVKNHSPRPQSREIEFRMGGSSTRQTVSLNPNSVAELKVAMPPEIDTMELRLNADPFPKDDILPIVRHAPKPLPVFIGVEEESRPFFSKLVETIPGARIAPRSDALVSIVTAKDLTAPPQGFSIILSGNAAKTDNIQMVTAENHPLTDDLAWGGLLFSAIGNLDSPQPKQHLLWSGNFPLAWQQQQALVLNWDWASSNAGRIPATVLMMRRFLEEAQRQSPGYWSGNFQTGAKLPIRGAETIKFTPVNGKPAERPYAGVMPDEPGYAEVWGGSDRKTPLFKGALFPGDARQGDFADCETFEQGTLNQQRLLEKVSSPDPLVPLWLALAGGALVLSWIPGKRERSQSAR